MAEPDGDMMLCQALGGGVSSAVNVVLEAGAELGEGPVWDYRSAQLLWVDIVEGGAHRLDPVSGGDVVYRTGQPVGFVALRRQGGVVLGLRDGIAAVDHHWAHMDWLAPVEADDAATRVNDGGCDARGRLWAGTMALDERPGAGSLYRMEADCSIGKVLSGVSISNGIDWSPDGTRMYYVDTPTGFVDQFDYEPETGEASNRRHLVKVPPGAGHPDGLTVDAAGHIWVALWGGGTVNKYAPEGTLEAVIEFPAGQVTSCCFGGPDLEDLYVTSAKSGLSTAELAADPHAGDLFVVRAGATGQPSALFAG